MVGKIVNQKKIRVRAILFDSESRLVLLKREKPDVPLYWVAPGGGLEKTDKNDLACLRRELSEELGATDLRVMDMAFKLKEDSGDQHFYLCKLLNYDPDRRTGSEYQTTAKGTYTLDKIEPKPEVISLLNIQPPELKTFLVSNIGQLLKTLHTPHPDPRP